MGLDPLFVPRTDCTRLPFVGRAVYTKLLESPITGQANQACLLNWTITVLIYSKEFDTLE